MPREPDTPQRIPKRRVQQGRANSGAASSPPNSPGSPDSSEGGATDHAAGQADSVPSTSTAASSVAPVAVAKPRSASRRDAGRKKPAQVTAIPKLNTAESLVDQTVWQRFRHWMKTAPALSFSLILHLIAFAGLGAVTFVTWQPKEELLITASSIEASDAPIEELVEIDMSELEEFEEESFESDVTEMSDVVLEDVAIDAPVADAIPDVAGMAPAVGTASKGENVGAKPSKKAGKKSSKAKASFYGAPAQGNRFAFIVDNSNSMVNGKMLTTIDQLLRTINSLTIKQEFYVTFYSDTAYPMFYPESESGWVKADKQNKLRLRNWLQTIELCSGGRLDLAMKKTFELEPDSIFLVGDGSDVGKAEKSVLAEQTKLRRYVIHTLCIGGNGKGAEKLAGIAEYTGGTFRFVQPVPGAVEMAKTNKFKMNKSRGRVWGKEIGR